MVTNDIDNRYNEYSQLGGILDKENFIKATRIFVKITLNTMVYGKISDDYSEVDENGFYTFKNKNSSINYCINTFIEKDIYYDFYNYDLIDICGDCENNEDRDYDCSMCQNNMINSYYHLIEKDIDKIYEAIDNITPYT